MKQASSLAPRACCRATCYPGAESLCHANQQLDGVVLGAKDTRGMTGQFFCHLYDAESECDRLVSYGRAVWKVDTDILSKAATGSETRQSGYKTVIASADAK